MLFTRLFITLFFLVWCAKSMAVIELDGEFNYERQIYGETRQNKITSRTYSGTLAFYIFNATAIEFNYSKSDEINTSKSNSPVQNSGYTVTGVQSVVENDVYGIGLRQALASQNARIRPMLSFGYAKQFTKSWTDFSITNDLTKHEFPYRDSEYKIKTDSAFAAFMLQLRLTQRFSLKASLKTVFPAFETAKIKDNLKYMAGFTWIF